MFPSSDYHTSSQSGSDISFLILRRKNINIFANYKKDTKLSVIVNLISKLMKIAPHKIKIILDTKIHQSEICLKPDLNMTLFEIDYYDQRATCQKPATIYFYYDDDKISEMGIPNLSQEFS
ncbi:MAG: hypothetical protein MHMPM18_000670 [Marteilia pararefringens]